MKNVLVEGKMKKEFYVVLIIMLVTIFVSAITSYLMVRSQINIRFVSEPRLDNSNYGYLEVNGIKYYQLNTTTQVDFGKGLHYHKIDIRGSVSPEPDSDDLLNQKELDK